MCVCARARAHLILYRLRRPYYRSSHIVAMCVSVRAHTLGDRRRSGTSGNDGGRRETTGDDGGRRGTTGDDKRRRGFSGDDGGRLGRAAHDPHPPWPAARAFSGCDLGYYYYYYYYFIIINIIIIIIIIVVVVRIIWAGVDGRGGGGRGKPG